MADNPDDLRPQDEAPPSPKPRWEIDEHGNVRGIIFTQEVDFFTEIVTPAIIPPERPADPETGP
jgi:hypothetical protein